MSSHSPPTGALPQTCSGRQPDCQPTTTAPAIGGKHSKPIKTWQPAELWRGGKTCHKAELLYVDCTAVASHNFSGAEHVASLSTECLHSQAVSSPQRYIAGRGQPVVEGLSAQQNSGTSQVPLQAMCCAGMQHPMTLRRCSGGACLKGCCAFCRSKLWCAHMLWCSCVWKGPTTSYCLRVQVSTRQHASYSCCCLHACAQVNSDQHGSA